MNWSRDAMMVDIGRRRWIWCLFSRVFASPSLQYRREGLFKVRLEPSIWQGFDRAQEIASALFGLSIGPDRFKIMYRYDIRPAVRLFRRLRGNDIIGQVPGAEDIEAMTLEVTRRPFHKLRVLLRRCWAHFSWDYDRRHVRMALERLEWLSGKGPYAQSNAEWRAHYLEDQSRRRQGWSVLSNIWLDNGGADDPRCLRKWAQELEALGYGRTAIQSLYDELNPIFSMNAFAWEWGAFDMNWIETQIIDRKMRRPKSYPMTVPFLSRGAKSSLNELLLQVDIKAGQSG